MYCNKAKKKRRKRGGSKIGRSQSSGSSKSHRRAAPVEAFRGAAVSTGDYNARAPPENADNAEEIMESEVVGVGVGLNAEPVPAPTISAPTTATTAIQKVKSLQNQLNYQKRKSASMAASNEQLKQKVEDTQQQASEKEKDYEALAKRQQKAVDDANKRAEKSREYFTFRYISNLSSAISHTLLFSSCFVEGEDC